MPRCFGQSAIHQRRQLQRARLFTRAGITRVMGLGHAARVAPYRRYKCRRFVGPARKVHQARDAQLILLRGPYGYVVGRRSRKRLQLHLTAETITNLNPLTPLPILRLFRTAGTLDALASCTSLTSVDVSDTNLEGQSARALGLVALNLHCKPPRPAEVKFCNTFIE